MKNRKKETMGKRRSRGSTSIIVVLLIVVLVGAAALVVDLGNLFRIRNELQTSADAAALAGAQMLNGSEQGLDDARQAAIEYAANNNANGAAVNIQYEDIVFGNWNYTTGQFTSYGNDPEDPDMANAIQVLTQRSAGRGDAVASFFAGIFGVASSDVSSGAIAVGGGPLNAECAFPMVVSDCSLDNADVGGNCEYCMVFQNNNSDTAGWTGFSPNGGLGNSNIAGLVFDACYTDGTVSIDANGQCGGNMCNNQNASTTVQVGNGNFLNTGNNACNSGDMEGCNNPCPVIQDILTRGGTVEPQSFLVTVPVLQSDPGTCSADQYSGQKEISGFAKMEIFGARCADNEEPTVDDDFPSYCQPPPSGDYVLAVLKCNEDPIGTSGGGFHGLSSRHYRLVR